MQQGQAQQSQARLKRMLIDRTSAASLYWSSMLVCGLSAVLDPTWQILACNTSEMKVHKQLASFVSLQERCAFAWLSLMEPLCFSFVVHLLQPSANLIKSQTFSYSDTNMLFSCARWCNLP